MKKLALVVVATVVLLLGGAYFYFSGKEYVLTITEEELRKKVNESLPYTERYLLIFVVTLDNARIELESGSNRINGGFDVNLNAKIVDEEEFIGGSLDISGGIRYDNQSTSFFLVDPKIENLSVKGVPEKHKDKTTKVLNLALSEYFKKEPIYSLAGPDAKKVAARMVLKDFKVEEESVIVTLGI